jgi:hypothetical protein
MVNVHLVGQIQWYIDSFHNNAQYKQGEKNTLHVDCGQPSAQNGYVKSSVKQKWNFQI